MERLVRERAGDQEELLKLRQQLRGLEQQLPDPYHALPTTLAIIAVACSRS